MNKSFLFVCGCPRSGTTALWQLLTADSRIRMGVERYGNRFFQREFLTPKLFEEERFFDLQDGDTFYSDLVAFNPYYKTAREGYSDAVYFGDKIPKLYEYFDRLKSNFLESKTIFIFRNIFDVAASYKARLLDKEDNWNLGVTNAIADWGNSLKKAKEYEGDIIFVDYERFFVEGEGLQRLYDYLQLEVIEGVENAFRRLQSRSDQLEISRPRSLNSLEVKEICNTADFNTYRMFVGKAVGAG